MDADLSQRLDGIERQIKVIRDIAVTGLAIAAYWAFGWWIPSHFGASDSWDILGLLAMLAVVFYYKYLSNEPKSSYTYFSKEPK